MNNIRGIELALYSDEFKIAGTCDCIAEYNGDLSIIDFKTSRSRLMEHYDKVQKYFMQATAYSLMWKERTGTQIDQIVIIGSEETGDIAEFIKIPFDFKDELIEKNVEFQQDKNASNIQLTYQNQKEQSAVIKAKFENQDIVKIDLEKPSQDYSYLLYVPIIALASLLGFLLYKKIKTKKKIKVSPMLKTIPEKPFDYVSASNRLIEEAKKDFKEQRHKEAYGEISQAIRLFLSYRAELKREITNEDILSHLTSDKYPVEDIKNCFKLSS